MDVNKIISHYLRLRDRKEALEHEHKQQLAPIKEDMQKIEAALQKVMLDQGGVRNIRGTEGTAYLEENVSTKVVDWQETIDYIKTHDRWDILDRRVNKTAAQAEPIPGVEVSRSLKTKIRRS